MLREVSTKIEDKYFSDILLYLSGQNTIPNCNINDLCSNKQSLEGEVVYFNGQKGDRKLRSLWKIKSTVKYISLLSSYLFIYQLQLQKHYFHNPE